MTDADVGGVPGTASSARPRVHAFVISWSGYADKAAAIATALEAEVGQLTVIHSEPGVVNRHRPGKWVVVPDSHFYGMKFRRSLELFAGDVMLQIQADADCADWRLVVEKTKLAFASVPRLGVWAPDVSFTPLPLWLVSLADDPTGLRHVALVDGVVWALSADVCGRLRQFDYTTNNVGWGIDWAAAAFAHATGRPVMVDPSLAVSHPMTRGYSTDAAEPQMERFLTGLLPTEQAMRGLIQAKLAPKRSDRPLRDGVRQIGRDLRHRARIIVDGLRGRVPQPTRPVPAPELYEAEETASDAESTRSKPLSA